MTFFFRNKKPETVRVDNSEHFTKQLPDQLLKRVADRVVALKRESDFNQSERTVHFDQIIRNLALHIQDLPATAYAHYARSYGLLEFCLDCANIAQRKAHGMVISAARRAEERTMAERSWRHAAFLTGLVYPLGELAAVAAEDVQRTNTWTPGYWPLYDWLEHHKLSSYVPTWKNTTTNTVCANAIRVLLAQRIWTPESLAFVEAGNTGMVNEMFYHLGGDDIKNVMLEELLRESHQQAIEQDMVRLEVRLSGTVLDDYEQAAHKALSCVARSWVPNSANSPLWVTELGVFLLWPRTPRAVQAWANQHDVLGVSSTEGVLLKDWIEAGLIKADEQGSYLQRVVIDAPGMSGLVAEAVCLSEETDLGLRYTVTPVPAIVFEDEVNSEMTEEPPVVEPASIEHNAELGLKEEGSEQQTFPLYEANSTSGERKPEISEQESGLVDQRREEVQLKSPGLMGNFGEYMTRILKQPENEAVWLTKKGLAMRFPEAINTEGLDPQQFLKEAREYNALLFAETKQNPWLHSIAHQGVSHNAILLKRELFRVG